jgi:exonuclease SbcC
MKILAIRIKNLASLEGTTEIDFTQDPLWTAGIFAITGPTGAGKSTILDALCLALYAQTPRYNKSSDPNQGIQDISGTTITQSDPRKILRDGASEGYAEVDFVGVDGNRYKAQWNVRRARSRVEGALQPYQISCKNLDTNEDAQGTKTEVLTFITQKVGLIFDQFTRAVLLAQGDFTAFLKAPNSEKSDLLEKLTGTHVYSEISIRIFERHRTEKEELTIHTVQKEGISIMNEEELENLNKRKTELTHLFQHQQKEEEILAKELAWHEKLHSLQQTLTESGQTLELANKQKKEAANRETKLAQVEQVQPVRVWVQSLASQQKMFGDKESIYKSLAKDLVILEEQQKEQNDTVNIARENLDSKIKEQEQAQPLLNQAKQLDTQLKDRAKQLEESESDLEQAKKTLDIHEDHVKKQIQQVQQLQQSVEQLETFVVQNQNRQSLAENDKLVLAALADAQTTLNEEQQALKEIKSIQQTFEAKQAEEKKQKEKLDIDKQTVQELSTKYTQLQDKFSAINIDSIQQNKKIVDAQVMETMQGIADWKILFETIASHEKGKAALQKNKEEQKANNKILEDTSKELESAQTRKEASYRSLEIARQELSANVVSLRQQLTENAPCSVCGSTDHPYAIHDPLLDKVLTKLEDDFKQQESSYKQALITLSALQEKEKQLEKEIANLSNEQLDNEKGIIEYRENWNRFALHAEAENRQQQEVSDWLKQHLSTNQEQQKNLQEQYERWQQQQREMEEHKRLHENATEQYRVTENALKDIHRDLESQNEKLDQAKKEFDKAVQKLVQMQGSLAIYFTNKDWFEHWKTDANAFTKRIKEFSAKWKSNIENLEKTRQEQEVLSATIKGEESKRELLSSEVTKKEKVVSESTQQYQTLLEERKQLFEGRSTDEVESQFKKAIDKAREELEQHKAKQEQLQINIASTTTKRDETQQEIQRLTKEIEELDKKIIQWLSNYNSNNPPLSREEMTALLDLPNEWIETERQALQQINNTLLQAQAVLNEHKMALEKHLEQPLSQRAIEAVTDLLAEVRATLQATVREDTETKLRLQQDADNRTRSGALLDQIAAKEKIVDNWAKLNHVIGSADGKKFRQVAQEYTLDVLLGYTNVQLDMLSKRYVLQRIPGSLGLQVVDQDMGNEVRTVNSLSGGESFLVSLALALGLASLSSNRMQVESLFIDEGFGSLDPNTLNIAMDALERLHNQGRKVGVISHVQEMMERIPVQIKVSKQNSGSSTVEVLGIL